MDRLARPCRSYGWGYSGEMSIWRGDLLKSEERTKSRKSCHRSQEAETHWTMCCGWPKSVNRVIMAIKLSKEAVYAILGIYLLLLATVCIYHEQYEQLCITTCIKYKQYTHICTQIHTSEYVKIYCTYKLQHCIANIVIVM